MFKSELPKNCPPKEVSEKEIDLYRLIAEDDIQGSFETHVELFPDREDFKTNCKANGISFFDNVDALLPLLEKEINEDKKIACVRISEDMGKISNKPTKRGHYTLWVYENANIEKIKFEIIEIGE